MKLIEKKCPNCGANLEFSETDKSCKCEYCHRSFEIERDENATEEYTLNAVKVSNISYIITSVISLLIIIVVFTFIMVGFHNFPTLRNQVAYYTDANELTNSDIELIDHDASMMIKSVADGPVTTEHSYVKEGDEVRKKIYVAGNNKANIIIAVYAVKYYDFFHPESRYTVYVPIQYVNVDKNDHADKFSNPQISAQVYYFDSEKKYSVLAYKSIDEFENDTIRSIKATAPVTEK